MKRKINISIEGVADGRSDTAVPLRSERGFEVHLTSVSTEDVLDETYRKAGKWIWTLPSPHLFPSRPTWSR